MQILIAEDEEDVVRSYRKALKNAGHDVLVSYDGEECIQQYRNAVGEASRKNSENSAPFDAVILDYKLPKKDGFEVAQEMLKINPHQRIIFASAYVMNTLAGLARDLKQTVELMQKPFTGKELVETVEDKIIYDGLKRLGVNIEAIKDANLSHEQLVDLHRCIHTLMERTPS